MFDYQNLDFIRPAKLSFVNKDTNTCDDCDNECKCCSGPDDDECTCCNDNTYLYDASCDSTCPEKYWANDETNTCDH